MPFSSKKQPPIQEKISKLARQQEELAQKIRLLECQLADPHAIAEEIKATQAPCANAQASSKNEEDASFPGPTAKDRFLRYLGAGSFTNASLRRNRVVARNRFIATAIILALLLYIAFQLLRQAFPNT